MNPTLTAQLETTVKDLLNEGAMFTAYDLTCKTREREQIRLKHLEVRDEIHQLAMLDGVMISGWYDHNGKHQVWSKTQVNLPQIGLVFVFHPSSLDPNTYTPYGVNPSATSSMTPGISSVTTPVASPQPVSNGQHVVDHYGRLMIPTRFLREAGISAGEVLQVITDSSNNTVTLKKAGSGNFSRKVERDGDVRLSKVILKEAGLDNNSGFSIQVINSTEILVK